MVRLLAYGLPNIFCRRERRLTMTLGTAAIFGSATTADLRAPFQTGSRAAAFNGRIRDGVRFDDGDARHRHGREAPRPEAAYGGFRPGRKRVAWAGGCSTPSSSPARQADGGRSGNPAVGSRGGCTTN